MEELYHKVLHLPLSWHQDNHSGSTINKLRKAYEALSGFFQHGFIFLYSFGKFFFSFGAMVYFSPLFGSIGVVLGIITIAIIRRFDKPFIATMKEVNQREHEVSSNLFDSLSNIVTVITLRLESRIHHAYVNTLLKVYPPFKRNVSINEWKWFTAQMLIGIIYGVTVIGYIYQNWQPGSTFMIGGLVILLGYVNQFTSVFNDVAAHYTQIMKYHAEVESVRDIEVAYASCEKRESPQLIEDDWETLDIKDLSFYRSKALSLPQRTGISHLSMRIQRGQRIALIGESGSGKSTLLALLRGLHAPQHGQALIDNSRDVPFEAIASTVTLFPQDPEIFENTVLYNITMGLPFSEEEVLAACHTAQFIDVVNSLSDGLHTNIVEKGVNLSGGQKQRLALARGILAARHSQMILLDEPTSSIDPHTEERVYKHLFEIFKGKAVISSLHRLHLLPLFDYVYVMADGVIIAEGTPENISDTMPVYARPNSGTNADERNPELVEVKIA